ncbi:MAG: nitrate- and nitrite sensing domain-containing protein [Thermobifida fusca]|uniref:nitrate- and nitrite sensing domain-containing protein n=1 Tax=Thermobifida fusca TaxID=2021 RepID=UPI000D1B3F9B|nr:nitrate- and nitrite sensing domain-containing protein [Thermobifida fusca]MDD6791031.1 nitrate- and nitrite sensing domain-containing protein [Thermobifida fusca]
MSTRATNNGADAKDDAPEQAEKTETTAKRPARRWDPRNWRVRSRLVALVVVPTAAALILGVVRFSESALNTFRNERTEAMVTLAEDIVQLGNELGKERMLVAAYIADNPNPTRRSNDRAVALQEQQKIVDQELNDVRAGANELGTPSDPLVKERLDIMLDSLEKLNGVREEVTSTRVTMLPAVTKYRQIISTLTDFVETLANATNTSSELRESVRALSALGRARDDQSYEAALMVHSLIRDSMSGGVQDSIESTQARYNNEIRNFRNSATPAQEALLDENYGGLDVSRLGTMRLRALLRADEGQPLTGITDGDDADSYQQTALSALDTLAKVESSLARMVRAEATAHKEQGRRLLLFDSITVLFVVVFVFLTTSWVARSMVIPLRVLRDGAMRIAAKDLPEAIVRMRETNVRPEEVKITPLEVDSSDEFGEVARSFDEVHRSALRLAADEAALRANVNAMFVNLSRRSQSLVERQLRLIEHLEQSEQDEERLAELFQLDHLATRMRRNNENLLVLSGQDNTRKWAQPVPLVDVLRAAVSEVEQYARVNVRAPSHVSVLGRPVNDVIHLIAELVENATVFSAHDTQVSVTAQAVDNGDIIIEITDSGIGMSAEELESANQKLAEPPVIDVAVSRRMGLFVVSRLANRHGIEVRLRPAHNGGITAAVRLPNDLLITPVEPTPPALTSGRGTTVPDTYAEATAAFASSPAPADPADSVWEPRTSNDRPVWEPRTTPSGLPKRPDPATRAAQQGQQTPPEHPPSGEDLWDAGWKRSVSRTTSPQPVADRPETPRTETPRPETPRTETPRTESPADTTSTSAIPTVSDSRPSAADTVGSSRTGGQSVYGYSLDRPGQRSAHPLGDTRSSTSERQGWQQNPLSSSYSSGSGRTEQPEVREGYGSTAYLSKRYGPGSGNQNTIIPPSPEHESNEPLPIFDSIESNWFRRRTVRPAVTTTETGPISAVSTPDGLGTEPAAPAQQQSQQPRPEDEWRSAADAGWKTAAERASAPIAGGITASGLPKRIPRANLVPGAAPAPENFKQITSRSAERVRSRFSSFQQGIRQGRDALNKRSSQEE